MSQDQFNEAYELGYAHGKQRCIMVASITAALCLTIGAFVLAL